MVFLGLGSVDGEKEEVVLLGGHLADLFLVQVHPDRDGQRFDLGLVHLDDEGGFPNTALPG